MIILQQLKVLILKNYWIAKQDRSSVAAKLLVPVVCLIICFILNSGFWSSGPQTSDLPLITKCRSSVPNCTPIVFNPNTPQVIAVMKTVAENNNLVFGVDVVPTNMTSPDAFRNYVYNSNMTVIGGIFFDTTKFSNFTRANISYTIVYNYTANAMLSMQTSVDRAIMQNVAGPDAWVTVRTKPFPEVGNQAGIPASAYTQAASFIMIYIACTFLIFPGINAVVTEKDKNILKFMKCFGLKSSSYWISWLLTFIVQHMAVALVLMAVGYAIPGLQIFNCNFLVHLLNFFTYGVGISGFICLVAVIVNGTVAANIAAAWIFAFGLGTLITTTMMGQFIYQMWSPTAPVGIKIAIYALYSSPIAHFVKVSVDITSITTGARNIDYTAVSPERFTLSHLTKSPYPHVPSPLFNMLCMFFLGLIYIALALLVDYLFFDTNKPAIHHRVKNLMGGYKLDKEEHMNVNAEVPKALSLINLSKSYARKKALNNISLHANEGSILVLLGPNGAGKTTLLNVLCGLLPASSGTAYINGHCIQTDMDTIRSSLGVCLQTDVYWPTLTAREHLYIFASLKASIKNVEHEITNKLDEVHLTKVGSKQVSTYSGGMRRRLSLAVSMIGDPSVILLDEPTFGIDVINQKYVWEIINNRKGKAKLIVLVTHSHEEALRSGDKIVVIADGVVRHAGTALEIRKQIGDMNHLTLLADVSKCTEIKEKISNIIPEATVVAENAGSIVYAIPKLPNIAHYRNQLLNYLQKEQDIKDWKFSTYAENFLIK